MGDVLTNCHTCGWDVRRGESSLCMEPDQSDAVSDWLEQSGHVPDATGMPPKTATGCPPWKPKPAAPNTDRAQLAILGADPFPAVEAPPTISEVVAELETMTDEVMTVRRAEWDALLARIDRLESRADEAERLARGVGPRVAALFRRDRLRGGR